MILKPQTLLVSIQCIAARTRQLVQQLNSGDPAKAAEIEQLLVVYDLAAEELKAAYELALEQSTGLPPYAELVKAPE
ncbi:hypothetical protein JL37_17200 [Achromobacter sp. RTa]|uniref:hypothetical protein n=1 Tax=Achromobacter sp. RTa TaxID=1532557 RepID=UPI00050EB1F8|nr:hypothetical protein [Achromobacter sp. RTa]KGD92384.1 hypothetical protein JL37_17200 [Achromobacter sp. RTa]